MGFFFLLWIISGIPAAYVATQKNKNGLLWLFLGTILGPIALLMVGFAPAEPKTEQAQPGRNSAKTESTCLCPFCAEEIKCAAVVCKHCGRDVPPQQPTQEKIAKAYASMPQAPGGKARARGYLSAMGYPEHEVERFLATLAD